MFLLIIFSAIGEFEFAQSNNFTATYLLNHNFDDNSDFDKFYKDLSLHSGDIYFQLSCKGNACIFDLSEKLSENDKKFANIALYQLDSPYFNNIGDSVVLYQNVKERYSFKNDKEFLVYKLKNKNWDLIDETKMISGYECFKAKTIDVILQSENDNITKNVIAWFTPEIPISVGPFHFSGLPGLILQLQVGNTYYTLSKIEFNNADTINFDFAGKKVSEKEFIDIRFERWMKFDE